MTVGQRPAMGEEVVFAGVAEGRRADQCGMVAEPDGGLGLAPGLFGQARDAGDHGHRPVGPVARRLRRQTQHRLVEAAVADGELGRVHADREPAGAGIEIVAGERTLAPRVELAGAVKRKRMGRNRQAGGDALANRPRAGRQRVSRLISIARRGFRSGSACRGCAHRWSSQSAVQSISSVSVTSGGPNRRRASEESLSQAVGASSPDDDRLPCRSARRRHGQDREWRPSPGR